MIKKILLTLGLFCIGLINYTYGGCSNNVQLYNFKQIGLTYPSVYDNGFNLGVLNKGSLLTQNLGYGKDVFSPSQNVLFFRDKEGLPYFYFDGYQGNPQYYAVCPEITGGFVGYFDYNICTLKEYGTGDKEIFKNFLSNVNSDDYFGYYVNYYDGTYMNRRFNVCISSHTIGNSLCFKFYYCRYNSSCHHDNCPGINSKGYENLSFASIDNTIYGQSPGLNGGDSGGGVPATGFDGQVSLSNSDIISYYESQYGFNYNMCFVGTWDFNQNDGTFKQGNGEHIFSYFNWYYGLGTGVNATGYKLSDVGKFIDEMYGNYDIYFNYGNRYANGDIAYIYKFYIDTHILDWVETGYNNPFEENTYVYTFYPKMLHYYTDYWRLYYYGGELANYCYYKLNLNNNPQEDIYGDLENDISQEQLDNIGMWHTIDYNFSFTQSGNNITVSEDWNDSPVDYFANLNSGGYENFDPGTFFSESFNRFKGVFGTLNPGDFGLGYLPGYIITFMLALILFRFLSH